MGEKIVVCGAGGFVGGKLVEFLLRQGHKDIRAVSSRPVKSWLKSFPEVDNFQADLRDPEMCDIALQDAGWVYNLAAKVGGIGYIGGNKTECLLSSLINTNLLLAASNHEASGYFFASSACVYGSSDKPIKETDPLQPSEGYGEEKVFSEKMCQAFAEEGRVPTRCARLTGVFGPGDDTKGAEGRDHAPSALCRKVVAAKLSGNHEVAIWGDGNQTRNFLYIDDAVRGIYGLMGSGCGPEPVNLGSSEVVTINQMVDMLDEISAVKTNRFYKLDAPCGVRYRVFDQTKLRSILHWEPGTPLIDGLRATYNSIWEAEMKK